jgi:hypothetical protein
MKNKQIYYKRQIVQHHGTSNGTYGVKSCLLRRTGSDYPSETTEFTSSFSGIRVTRSLVVQCFVAHCLYFCPL